MKSIEQLTKAQHDADFLVESLRGALAGADAVEALVLLPLIAESSRMALNIGAQERVFVFFPVNDFKSSFEAHAVDFGLGQAGFFGQGGDCILHFRGDA